jgi:thiol-disulfide isomerase/thioredoxin
MRRRQWLVALAVLIMAQLAFIGLYQRLKQSRKPDGLRVEMERRSDPAPDLVVELPDGSRRTMSARSERFQLVHFWATWCPPCRKEIPSLLELARRDPTRLEVWAISTDPRWGSVREFFQGDVPASVVRDPTGAATRAYVVTGLPDSYLLDPGGRVVARFAGGQHWSSAKMRKILDRLIVGS